MKKVFLFAVIAAMFGVVSCGNSKKQAEAEQARLDSIRIAEHAIYIADSIATAEAEALAIAEAEALAAAEASKPKTTTKAPAAPKKEEPKVEEVKVEEPAVTTPQSLEEKKAAKQAQEAADKKANKKAALQ
jgi:hypothetical protein